MKNLKKVLAFVVVFAMMLTCSVSAASFADVPEDAAYAEAATVLSSLGLMIGDDLGNFNPDKILTRAEATALIMRAKGLESAAAGAADAKQFNDVPATHWASGYINLAAQSKVVNGYGDGNFGPEDEVKYEQFVKMVVAALDYEPKANLYGGYPSGYLIIASQKDITKSVPGTAGQPIPRRTVAQILFNALDVGMMELTLDNKGTVQYSDGDDTLLSTYLYISQYEGVLENVSYNTDADGNIKVTVGGNWRGVSAGVYGDARAISVDQADTNAETLRGYTVAAYVATDATGKAYLKAIAPKTGKNDVVVVDYTQIETPKYEEDGVTIAAAKYYADPADYTPVELPLAPSYKKIYNNSATNGYMADEVDTFLEGSATNGKAIFVNNNMDDSYDYVFVSSYDSNDVVDAIDAVNGTIAGKEGELVDIAEKNSIWTFIKNDDVVDFEDIAVGNVLSIQEGKLGQYTLYTVYVSDVVVEGVAAEKRTDSNSNIWFTIGTEEYQDLNALVQVGDEGKFFLNVDGKIVYTEAVRPTAGNYAYLLDAAINNQGIGSGAVEVKFLTIEGEWKVAQVADRVSVKLAGDARGALKDAAEVADGDTEDLGIYTLEDVDADADEIEVELTAVAGIFQYELNSAGKISKIVMAVNGEDDDEFSFDDANAAANYKASTDRLGSVYLGENTKVFHIDTAKLAAGKDEGITIASTGLFVDGEAYNVEFYDKDLNGYPEVVVVFDANPDLDIATHPVVISKVVDATNADGYAVTKFYGFQAGEEVQVDSVEGGIDNVEVTARFLGVDAATYEIGAGDVVIVGLDAKGNVEKMDVLMSAELAGDVAAGANLSTPAIDGTFEVDASDVTASGAEKAARNIFGYASKTLSNGRVVLNYMVDDALTFGVEILRGQDLHFYTVNLGGRSINVKTSGIGSIETSNKADKAGSWVFVREYDSNPVCVVIYTYTNPVAADVVTATGALNGAVEAE